MRDPKRIRSFCNQLADAWEAIPDMRFGQLALNVFSEWQSKTKRDVFFVEDDEILNAFKDFVSKYYCSPNESKGEQE